MAWPCLPDERLAMKRTGSIGSLVGPEVTSTRLPASALPPRWHGLAAAAISKRLGHAADAGLAALGHLAGIRPDEMNAVRRKLRQIALRRLGRPHMRIHRRRDQDRLVGCQQNRGGEIVGMAARHLRDQVGGRRRDHDEVGVARQADMADIEFALRIEQIGIGALAGAARRRQAA